MPSLQPIALRSAYAKSMYNLYDILRQLSCVQGLSKHSDLSVHHFSASTSDGITSLDACLEVKDIVDVLSELIAQFFEVLQCQLIEGTLSGLGKCNSTSRDVMCLPEGNLK